MPLEDIQMPNLFRSCEDTAENMAFYKQGSSLELMTNLSASWFWPSQLGP